MRIVSFALALTTGLSIGTAALALDEPPPRPADNGGPPRVYYVHSYYHATRNQAGLGERISVYVQNFPQLLAKTNGNCGGIVLFMNGSALPGIKPESCDPSGHVRFRLVRTEESYDAWRSLLGSPRGFTRPVQISVGSDKQFSVASDVDRFQLEVVPRRQFFLFLVLLIAGVVATVWLCRTRGMIRIGNPSLPQEQRPFSLALFQMAFWFFLVIAAYVFVWMITGELDTITESVLGLIGIGAATALGSEVIDQGKPEAKASGPSRGFLTDVLADDSGSVSLHRFQMFAWTLVLGVIFIASVYENLAMPQFSATLLGLMGVSSGTYLGFKVPESKATDAPPPPATTA